MKAMDVMVRDVVTVKPETDVASALKLLIEHDISALAVVDDAGTVVGMLSEADVIRREENGAEIATLVEKHRIKRVPIIEDGKLLGIVRRSNLVQALASSLQAEPAKETDREIRHELLSRLADQDWTGFGSRNIIVTGGVVHLWGLVGSPEERTALISLAEGVRGVVGVSDEMIPSYG